MSYKQVMKWHKNHPKGGKPQYMGFSAGSGFWASVSFIESDYNPYASACESEGCEPLKIEDYYNFRLRGRIMSFQNTPQDRARYTKIMSERARVEGLTVADAIRGTP